MNEIRLLSILRILIVVVRNSLVVMGIFFFVMLLNLDEIQIEQAVSKEESELVAWGMLKLCLVLASLYTVLQFLMNRWYEKEQRADEIKNEIWCALGYYKVTKN